MLCSPVAHPPRSRAWRREAAAVALTVVCGCCAPDTPSSGDLRTGVNSPAYELTTAGRRVTLPRAEWREMQNEAPVAKNFEPLKNPPHRTNQVVTVFLIPMSEDRRSGQPLSTAEYLEVSMTTPGLVVVQLRRDHSDHWVLSREVFEAAAVPTVDLTSIRALTEADVAQITQALRLQIDTTRHLLGERLRAS